MRVRSTASARRRRSAHRVLSLSLVCARARRWYVGDLQTDESIGGGVCGRKADERHDGMKRTRRFSSVGSRSSDGTGTGTSHRWRGSVARRGERESARNGGEERRGAARQETRDRRKEDRGRWKAPLTRHRHRYRHQPLGTAKTDEVFSGRRFRGGAGDWTDRRAGSAGRCCGMQGANSSLSSALLWPFSTGFYGVLSARSTSGSMRRGDLVPAVVIRGDGRAGNEQR